MSLLEQLAADPDLVDIDVVNAELRNIRAQQQKVVQLAKGLLNQGLANENSIQTSTALQVHSKYKKYNVLVSD